MLNQEEKVESVIAKVSEQTPLPEINTEEVNSTKEPLEQKKKSEGPLVPLSKLVDGGIHIGLKPNKWNPKMKNFIFTKKFNHIIDIRKTVAFLEKAFSYLVDIVKSGGEIIFVGTKNKLVRNLIKDNATRVGSYYVTQRWLGGTLTNFTHLSHSIKKLNNLENLLQDEESKLGRTKKEWLNLIRQRARLEKFYSGVKNMNKLPQVMVCFDPVEDKNAILEARKMNIPIVAVSNTNANPDLIDFIIPANNFSVRSAYILVNVLTDAVAYANNQETVIAFKKESEIILPDIQKRTSFNNKYRSGNYIPYRSNNRYNYQNKRTYSKPTNAYSKPTNEASENLLKSKPVVTSES